MRALRERNQNNVTAGHGATGNPRWAKSMRRNVCAQPSLSRVGKILLKAYLNDFQQKITKFNNRNSNERQAPVTGSGTVIQEREKDTALLSPCHTPALALSRGAAACSAFPPLRGLFAETALKKPSSRCLKNAE